MIDIRNIEIWEPKYSDKTVLIDPRKVGKHNVITFTKGTYKGQKYYADEQTILDNTSTSNGKIQCKVVPLSRLEKMAEPEGQI